MFKIIVVLAFVAVAYGFPFPEDVHGVPVKDDVVKHVVPMKFDGIKKDDDTKKDLKDSSSFAYAYYRPYYYPLIRSYYPNTYIQPQYPQYRYWY